MQKAPVYLIYPHYRKYLFLFLIFFSLNFHLFLPPIIYSTIIYYTYLEEFSLGLFLFVVNLFEIQPV